MYMYMRGVILWMVLRSVECVKYPYNPSIHMFGNHGLLGRLHAEVAPIFTKGIDKNVYKRDVRSDILEEETLGRTVLDIGCGVGYSTSSNAGSKGIDTSVPMVEKARSLFPEKEFDVGDGEEWNCGESKYDVVTMMYLFHEAPQEGRLRLLERAKELAREKVIIVDISPEYIPSASMLAGEPYILNYLSNINDDLSELTERVVVRGHVHCWIYHQCVM